MQRINMPDLRATLPAMLDLPRYGADVREAGARGDGTGDDSPAFEKLLQRGEALIVVPPGEYPLARPIRMRSRTRLLAHPLARIRIADGARWGVRDALLTNADWEGGDTRIEISGGTWDGNCARVRRAAEDERDGYTGNLMLFRNVEGLALSDLKLCDPASYFVCLGKVRRFRVERIRFEILHHTRNQDGIHVSGQCGDGIIRDIHGYGKYCPGDDLVALNAADALDRSETRSCLAGPIRRITVSGLRAEDCHAFMRFASVWSAIEDIDVRDLEGGCVDAAINADALRFCRSPLFELDDPAYANGCGNLRDIRLARLRVWKTRDLGSGMLQLHSRMQRFAVEDFERVMERDANPAHPSLELGFIPGATGRIEGLNTLDREALTAASAGVDWRWQRQAAPGQPALSAGFQLGDQARLRGNLPRFSRLWVDSTPLQPLPAPDWNKGMSR
jgi:hypothetical protein